MLCVPIQVELTEAFDEPEGTSFIAIGGFVTGGVSDQGSKVFRPYFVCIGEGGKMRAIPLDVCKFVTVLPQSMFVVEPPAASGIIPVSASGGPLKVN